MKVKELIEQLKQLPQNSNIVITAMDDHFLCESFEVHSPYDDQSQEIIMNVYIDSYSICED